MLQNPRTGRGKSRASAVAALVYPENFMYYAFVCLIESCLKEAKMLGAIIGDIVGSRFERNNIKTKNFEFFSPKCKPTDDSVMTLAIAQAVVDCEGDYLDLGAKAAKSMRDIGRRYPDRGYGSMFRKWLLSEHPEPYNSFGNGAAMRVSACGFAAKSLEEAKALSRLVTEVSHNHPEGLKGAEAVAASVFLAKTGAGVQDILELVSSSCYRLDFTLDSIRPAYKFDASCQGTVPQAIVAFAESASFEDAIRNAISIGGDSDTLGAITGAVAQAYYGVPLGVREKALSYLDDRLLNILLRFEEAFPPPSERAR
jgi:type I restriction enzyme M protein